MNWKRKPPMFCPKLQFIFREIRREAGIATRAYYNHKPVSSPASSSPFYLEIALAPTLIAAIIFPKGHDVAWHNLGPYPCSHSLYHSKNLVHDHHHEDLVHHPESVDAVENHQKST